MNPSSLELLMLCTQVLLIPLARYFIHQQKKETISETNIIITKHYMSLENLIEENKRKIEKIEDSLKHRAELNKIKYGVLQARIKDIELYLKKQNGFQVRQVDELDNSDFS